VAPFLLEDAKCVSRSCATRRLRSSPKPTLLIAKMDAGTITEAETARLNAITSTTAATATTPAVQSELAKVNAEIAREEVLMDERRSIEAGSNVNADTGDRAHRPGPGVECKDPPKFKSFGEQMMAIASAGMPGVAHRTILAS
jgi:hypothetical protein